RRSTSEVELTRREGGSCPPGRVTLVCCGRSVVPLHFSLSAHRRSQSATGADRNGLAFSRTSRGINAGVYKADAETPAVVRQTEFGGRSGGRNDKSDFNCLRIVQKIRRHADRSLGFLRAVKNPLIDKPPVDENVHVLPGV